MAQIGVNIRELRKKKGLTQDELAEQLFVTRQTISHYETGSTKPDPDTITKLAEILEADANTMFYGETAAQALETSEPQPSSEAEIPPLLNRRSILSFILSSLTLLVLAVATLILYRVGSYLRYEQLMAGPFMLVKFFLIPLTLFVLGRWLVHAAETFFRISILQRPWYPKVRLALIIILAAVFVFHLPYLIWFACTTVERIATGQVIVTSQMIYLPVFQQIAYALMDITLRFPFVYTLIAMLLKAFKHSHNTT